VMYRYMVVDVGGGEPDVTTRHQGIVVVKMKVRFRMRG
jgi:hypothetical protein